VCLDGGLSCDLNALTTHLRTADCIQALADGLVGVVPSCSNDPPEEAGWTGRPSIYDGKCYYALDSANLDCTISSSNQRRFCPCS